VHKVAREDDLGAACNLDFLELMDSPIEATGSWSVPGDRTTADNLGLEAVAGRSSEWDRSAVQ
jgi:hypothetical protein